MMGTRDCGGEDGRQGSIWTEFHFGGRKTFWRWWHNNVSVLNASELSTLRQLKSQILCYLYH
jgi:hypothetical protein